MKELSLNILDIAKNSVKAGADTVRITLDETDALLTISVEVNGCGMTPEFLGAVTEPFTTTRTTRKVGLGLPLLKMAAEATGGSLEISSRSEKEHADHGTEVTATFYTDHIDCPPLGDIVSTVVLLLQNAPFEPRYVYSHSKGENVFSLDTDELHEQLGPDIPLSEPAVLEFTESYLREGEEGLG
jgi:hypothetical protein